MTIREIHKSLLRSERILMEAAKDRVLKPIETAMTSDFEEIFRLQGYHFLREFSKYQTEFAESFTNDDAVKIWGKVAIATQGKMTDKMVKGTSAAMAAGYNTLGKAVGWGVDLSFSLENPRAVQYLTKNAAAKVTAINETTRKEIARIVTKGVEEGTSYAKMAREIKGKFDEFSVKKPQLHIRNRAELVSVTETANAYGEGNYILAQDLADKGLVMIKAWQTVGDDRVTDECLDNEAAGWIPQAELFPSGDEHEPRFPGCRCTVLYDTQVTT
jgi:uncharacterized protein with gpF-like domain